LASTRFVPACARLPCLNTAPSIVSILAQVGWATSLRRHALMLSRSSWTCPTSSNTTQAY
jgi:hypothetical protein